jgi:hypothetical protein
VPRLDRPAGQVPGGAFEVKETTVHTSQAITNAALARFLGQDAPRTGPRVQIRVRTSCATLVIAGIYVPWEDGTPVRGAPGVRDVTMEIFAEDLPKFRKELEDASAAKLEQVREQLDADFKEWTSDGPGEKGRPAEEFPGSFEGVFRRLMRRDMRPILEIEELDTKPSKKAA